MAKRSRPPRWLPALVGGLAILAAVVAVWLWARHMMATKPEKVRQVPQVVQLIRPPPPEETPPPPPPPEKEEEPVPQDNPPPDSTPDTPSPSLGIDADASAGGDAFGLAARRGGADLVGTGNAIFAHYTAQLRDAVQDALEEDPLVRRGTYTITVHVLLAADGSIRQATLVQGTGNKERDKAIERVLLRVRGGAEGLPLEMPQQLNLKIQSRG